MWLRALKASGQVRYQRIWIPLRRTLNIFYIQQWAAIGIWCEMCVLGIIRPAHLFIVRSLRGRCIMYYTIFGRLAFKMCRPSITPSVKLMATRANKLAELSHRRLLLFACLVPVTLTSLK